MSNAERKLEIGDQPERMMCILYELDRSLWTEAMQDLILQMMFENREVGKDPKRRQFYLEHWREERAARLARARANKRKRH